jgi:hypothetical protein
MLPYRPMMQPYSGSLLEEELAYRRERLMASHGVRTRPGSWFRGRRRSR